MHGLAVRGEGEVWMKRMQRKFKCDDCGAENWLHWTERTRRSLPRCTNCGSSFLSPVTKEAKEDIRVAGEAAKSFHGHAVHADRVEVG